MYIKKLKLAQDEDIIQVLNKYYSIDKKNRLK